MSSADHDKVDVTSGGDFDLNVDMNYLADANSILLIVQSILLLQCSMSTLHALMVEAAEALLETARRRMCTKWNASGSNVD